MPIVNYMSSISSRNPVICGLSYPADIQRSLYSMFSFGASRVGCDAEAIWYFGNRISYGQLMDEVHAFAAGLVCLGVGKGDFVTICLPNMPQCVVAVYAVNRLGAICNLVHPLSTKEEISHAVQLCESQVILTFELNEAYAQGLGAKIIRCETPEYFPRSPKGFVMKTVYRRSVRKTSKVSEALSWSDVLASGRRFLRSSSLPADTMQYDDTAVVMYTGGTTGDAKGVLLSNGALNVTTASLIEMKVNDRCHEHGAFLTVLPVFHAFGLAICIHAPLSCGMRMLLSPRFSPKECARLVLKERAEILAGVPAMYERMYPYLCGHDLSFVQHIVCGGDLVSSDLVYRYNVLLGREFGGASFLPGYGLTECGGACILVDEDRDDFPEGCVGHPVNGLEMCLVEPGTVQVLPDTAVGELCLRGKSIMSGYYKNADATADALRRHADGNVWLHTGDVVAFDDRRNIIFKSRYKRMVKINGYNVYPTIIENMMEKCSAVSEACAVAVPWKTDKKMKLYVTLLDVAADRGAAVNEVMAYAREHLNRWECPFAVSVLDVMPRTKMNKKDYRFLESLRE